MTVILFLIILSILIFVHEFGHFIVAKKSGIRVDEFAIGFPPKIFSWTKNGTKYALNLIPFGGYVKIFGENPDEESTNKNANDSFVNKSKLTQSAVLIAGVLFNVLFAWVLFSTAFLIGYDITKNSIPFIQEEQSYVKVLSTEEETPASRAGIEKGYQLNYIQKNEEKIDILNSEQALFVLKGNDAPYTLNFTDKDGINKDIVINSKIEKDGEKIIGVYLADFVNTKSGFFQAISRGFLLTGFVVKEITVALKDFFGDLFTGHADVSGVAGPVGIATMVKDAAQSGLVDLIIFTAFISINLAILNLLPFPALDGGRLLFILIEKIIGRDLNPKYTNIVNLIGFAILILLMIVVTVHDIGKFF